MAGGLVNHGSPVGLAPQNQSVISTSIGIFDDGGDDLGYIQSLSPTFARGTTVVYHLNKADAGRGIEQQPQIEKYTLTATGMALYNKTPDNRGGVVNRLVGVTGAGIVVLNDQQIPFNLRQEETHPGNELTNVTLYLGCMATSLGRPVNIGTISVIETAGITALWVEGE